MTATTTNDLADVTTTGRPSAPIRGLIYGPNGVGKTTFISKIPGIYLLPTEDGSNRIRVAQYKTRIRSLDLLYTILRTLRDKRHPYLAVGLDSASLCERLIIEQIEARLLKSSSGQKNAPKTIVELNDDYGAGYAAVASEWATLLDMLDELRDKREMQVWFTCPSKTETVKNLAGKDYQAYTLDLYGAKSIKVITSWMDYVLFARQDVSVSEEKRKVISLTGQLSVYTRGTAEWTAKTRGEIPWPARLPLDYGVVARLDELIGTHGSDLPGWLTSRFTAVVGDVAEGKKREVFSAAVVANLRVGSWHVCDELISQAEAEAGGDVEEEENEL